MFCHYKATEEAIAMPDWSIKFVPTKNPKLGVLADFVLDGPGDPPGPFNVFNGDLVSWNNTTGDNHQPAVFAAVGGAGPPVGHPQPIGGTLQPRKSSPAYPVAAPAGSVIRFCCTLHAGEFGVMVVTTPGQPPAPPPSV
jgi:hypothetical protein